jgi:uncharacterized protein (TIGR00730 family)
VPLELCDSKTLICIMNKKVVTIFGAGRARVGDAAYALAYETGMLLAQAGFAIANGGYGGTMLAAAKGATEAGGKVIGVTCSAFKSSRANEYTTREVVTHSLDERLKTLVELGRAYVVLPGGTGTLLELAKVWELKNKGFLKTDRPIILVGKFWKSLVDLVATDDPDSRRYVELADDPKQVVEKIGDL